MESERLNIPRARRERHRPPNRHRAALQSLVNSIECNLGFAVLVGVPGIGKTSLLL
jgi:hypothetical protein